MDTNAAMVVLALTAFVVPSSVHLANTNWASWASRKDRAMPVDGFLGWRAPCLEYLVRKCRSRGCGDLDLYEFGVYTGRSIRGITHFLGTRGGSFRRMWGFDSFEGLPQEDSLEPSSYTRLTNTQWSKGSFNAADILHAHTFTALTAQLDRYIADDRVRWIPGFFNESLTNSLAHQQEMRPALFVDVDCDLYSSAYQGLDWMFQNRLMAQGTIIGYDDWGSDFGEKRAHREIAAKYNATFRAVPESLFSQPCFELISLGKQ